MDHSCGGNRPLTDACVQAKISV
ncbi:MAG: hypothetical protein ACXVKH_11670 [Candidatus Angelobacter sp.]